MDAGPSVTTPVGGSATWPLQHRGSGGVLQGGNATRHTRRQKTNLCLFYFISFPISSLQHKGGSFSRLDNASVFTLLSGMDFLSLPVQREAVAITSLITVRRSNYRADSPK